MIDIDHLRQWVGKSEMISDEVDLATCRRMEAMLDRDPELEKGRALPPLWHWLYFHQPARQGQLGRDGHPKKGGFLPPVQLPRRMWAGGRFEFLAPLPIGELANKTSTIKSVEAKAGRSGPLCFVTVEHRISCEGRDCLIEQHDIVYRSDPAPKQVQPRPPLARKNPQFSRKITPSPVMLFRYSALTFNGHRIHYDRDYCRDIEGYPGLVFHGPLTATLMLQLAMEHNGDKVPERFEFRAISPLYDTASFELRGWVNGKTFTLEAVNPEGRLAMQASVGF